MDRVSRLTATLGLLAFMALGAGGCGACIGMAAMVPNAGSQITTQQNQPVKFRVPVERDQPLDVTNFLGQVTEVVAGDTYNVLYQGQTIRVRLVGAASPRLDQPYGETAKALAAGLLAGKTVRIKSRKLDGETGVLAEVLAPPDDRPMSLEMVRAGLAWYDRSAAPDDPALAAAETVARQAGRGLWAGKNPVAPWAWKKPADK